MTESGLPNKDCLLNKVQRPFCQGQATDEEESRGEVRQWGQLNHSENPGISSGHDSGQRAGRARKQQRCLSDEKCEGFNSSDQPSCFMKLKSKCLPAQSK